MGSRITHDLLVPGYEVNLPGAPFGLDFRHDVAYVLAVPSEWAETPGGAPIATLRHAVTEDELILDCRNIPHDTYTAFVSLANVAWGNDGGAPETITVSPLGTLTYGVETWRLVSTLRDWRQVQAYRWEGRIVLSRTGGSF